MKVKTAALGLFWAIVFVITYQSCVINDKTNTIANAVMPQRLPSVIPGFNFPESADSIYGWLNSRDTISITRHAWGIWAGLTANSNQVYNLTDTLLVYETWPGISDLASLCLNGDSLGGCNIIKSTRENLDFPRQLTHAFGVANASAIDENPGFYVSVSYDPNAACFATRNMLLNQSTINKRLVSGKIASIDPFPDSSVTIKPTYFIGKTSDKLIRIPAWQGPPGRLNIMYGPSKWNSYVYADVENKQTPGKIAVPVDSSQTTPPSSAIVNLNEFIYYAIDSAAAAYINAQEAQQADTTVQAGDLAILVCMHVATKEISNWTWQTFFWTTNPASPEFPSSQWQADIRPKELKGAAAHYAIATAYAMVWPNQPITGGTNTGVTPIIGFNPYLEAGLSAPLSTSTNKLNPSFQFGMQTNCMSCHALAACNLKTGASIGYTADQYIDMNDSTIFTDWVQVDFAWSIQGNMNAQK